MRAKILIVEDELYTGEALKILLEELDYEVLDIVTSGEEAIEKIRESPPDLILMDIMLDGQMTGIEAAQEINGTYEIPVIFLTAYGDFKTIQKAKLCSPYGYLVKPITEATELQPSIELALFNHKEKQPFVFYLHPWEIDHAQPRFRQARLSSRFRHYNNLSKTMDRFERLLNDFDFIPLPVREGEEERALPA